MFVFFYIRRAANLNSVQPPLITCTQTLTHTINLVGERLALIGPKWDFSWLCATENDRLCAREVKTIWSHRSPQRCQTNRKRNNRKPVWGRIFFFVPLFPPFLPPSRFLSLSHTQTKKKERRRIGIPWSFIIRPCCSPRGRFLPLEETQVPHAWPIHVFM